MTRLLEETAELDSYPGRQGFRNFARGRNRGDSGDGKWCGTLYGMIGVKWEWQNRDRYARRRGEIFNLFACARRRNAPGHGHPAPRL